MNDRKLTVYQRLYYAWQLTRRMAGDNPDLLTPSLAGSQVDLNPRQIEAERNDLIAGLVQRLQQRAQEQRLFTIEWELV